MQGGSMNLEQLPVADGMTTAQLKAKQTLMRCVRVARWPGFAAQSDVCVRTQALQFHALLINVMDIVR